MHMTRTDPPRPHPPARPGSPSVLTLLTDFGLDDPYVGVMKGVVLRRLAHAQLVDLTHGVAPQDVRQAAVLLQDSHAYFPEGTVHLVVVDPGVGTERAVLVAAAGGQRFVGPDNGVLAPVLEAASAPVVVRLDRPDLALQDVSSTFHGRDIMAPAAAALAGGSGVEEMGARTSAWCKLALPQAEVERGAVRGEVLYADRFGNLVSNIRKRDLAAGGLGAPEAAVCVASQRLAGIQNAYACVAPGTVCALINSVGRLEIAVRNGSAAAVLGMGPGAKIAVHRQGEDA